MSRAAALPLLVAVLTASLLAGCAGPQRRPELPQSTALAGQAARERLIEAQKHWQLEGRVAVRNGEDGGSGQLSWKARPGTQQIALRAPLGGQGWELSVSPGRARLDGLEGGPRSGRDPDRLLSETVGWDIPLASLSRWVRGLRANAQGRMEFGSDGLPTRLYEQGWRIDFRRWQLDHDPPLPGRIDAESGERRVRLLVRAWTVGDDA